MLSFINPTTEFIKEFILLPLLKPVYTLMLSFITKVCFPSPRLYSYAFFYNILLPVS